MNTTTGGVQLSTGKANQPGFTLVEVVVILVVIIILAAGATQSVSAWIAQGRDTERVNDVITISRQLERYYKSEAVATGATYPPTSVGNSALSSLIGSSEAVTAPGQTSSSLSISSNAGAQSPTINQYIYQPLSLDGSLCATAPCVRYILYYRLERSPSVKSIVSLRQQ